MLLYHVLIIAMLSKFRMFSVSQHFHLTLLFTLDNFDVAVKYINGEIIINCANMYLNNLLPKRFRLSASSEVYNQ